MFRIVLFAFLLSVLLGSFSQGKLVIAPTAHTTLYHQYNRLYEQAEALNSQPDFNDQTEQEQEKLYQESLTGFLSLLPVLKRDKQDSLAFHSYLKAGLILHFLDSITTARQNYFAAITLKKMLPAIEDSFLFKPYLFTGMIYYSENNYDSAMHFYKKAEEVQEKYTATLKESQRLYNVLGVLYYEAGNYRQAKNYFEKAIVLLPPADPYYKELLVNYKINIASILIKLEEYDEAHSIYQSILPYKLYTNEIIHNTGIINQKLGAYQKAIDYFRQVNYARNKKNIDLYYNLAMAYDGLEETDSANLYIQKALAENLDWNGSTKNVQHGLILKFTGDRLTEEKNYDRALEKYQEAILQFSAEFNSKDIYQNPGQFSGQFAYINLFNTLTAKADAFEKSYSLTRDTQKLTAALGAYISAFGLADYVEKTYDSDEARLFLNRIKYLAHQKPINVCLRLYELTKQERYLEEAYRFDQRNKASILSLTVQGNEIRKKKGTGEKLFQDQAMLRSRITRLSLRAGQITDSNELHFLHASIRDHEIELGKVQDAINKHPVYGNHQFAERIPPIRDLQKKLAKNTALISYHLSENELLALCITRDQFNHSLTSLPAGFRSTIDSFKKLLGIIESGNRYAGSGLSSILYKILVDPLQTNLRDIERLIIIPDDELHYLPFEALADAEGKYLVERFSVQYQYSTALLSGNAATITPGDVLAFAPFVSKGFTDSAGTDMNQLPASKDEVIHLKGTVLLDKAATKQEFLKEANQYDILHLATHASINNDSPQQSFIAFYPGAATSDYKLYVQEIYDMKLDSLKLVLLSACETGTGQLIKGEGLMSLSRAFAYAGCPNIITSLWEAEDQTTAFITKRLHHYIGKGYSGDKALQKAKTDLLSDPGMDSRFKSPNYWAHLVFIGQYESPAPSYTWWIFSAIVLTAIFIAITINKKKK